MKVDKAAERQKDRKLAKQLVGRTIVKAEPCGGISDANADEVVQTWMHNWVLTLDDGSQLALVVEEHPDGGEYGVDIVRREPT